MDTDVEGVEPERWEASGGVGPYRDGEIHVLSEKCSSCVFRSSVDGRIKGLKPGGVKELVKTNKEMDTAFACHQTIYREDVLPAVCRGYYDGYKDEITPLMLAQAMGVIAEDEPPTDKPVLIRDDLDVDALVRAMYEARARTMTPYTDERWESIKRRFPGSISILRQEVMQQIEDGEFDE